MTHDSTPREAVYLPYRDWVLVLEALDSAREETLKAATANKTGFAARKALTTATDRYTVIGEDLSSQLEPEAPATVFDELASPTSGLCAEDIPDPRDGFDPTETPPRRGKRKNGPLANL